jgi:hypothetical protein
MAKLHIAARQSPAPAARYLVELDRIERWGTGHLLSYHPSFDGMTGDAAALRNPLTIAGIASLGLRQREQPEPEYGERRGREGSLRAMATMARYKAILPQAKFAGQAVARVPSSCVIQWFRHRNARRIDMARKRGSGPAALTWISLIGVPWG